jgi:membrane protease YdiL (CAAX protease family)
MQTTSSPISAEPWSGRSAVAAGAWILIAAGIVTLGFLGQAGGEQTEDVFYSYDLAVSTVVVYAVLVGITFWIARRYASATRALGLRGGFRWRWVWIACGFIVVAVIIAAALEPFLHGGREQGLSPDRWEPDRAVPFALNGLVAATVVPFTEELFYRGLGVRAFRFLGGVWAIALTAVAFAFGHAVLAALPPLLFFGLALGWVRLRSDSVWPGIAAHAFYNALAVLITFVTLQ